MVSQSSGETALCAHGSGPSRPMLQSRPIGGASEMFGLVTSQLNGVAS